MSDARRPESEFLALNTQSAWARGCCAGDIVISEDGLALAEMPDYGLGTAVADRPVLAGLQVRDFAVGACLLYILNGPDTTDQPAGSPARDPLLAYDARMDRLEPIVTDAPDLLVDPISLALAGNTLYLAANTNRLLALTRLGGQGPWHVTQFHEPASADLPGAVGFTPADLAASRDEHLYALDAGTGLILEFDASGKLQRSLNIGTLAKIKPVLAISPDGLLHVLALPGPQAERAEPAPAGSQTASLPSSQAQSRAPVGPAIWRIDPRPGKDPAPVLVVDLGRLVQDGALPQEFDPEGLAIDRRGIIFVGEGRKHPGGDEDTRFLQRFDPTAAQKYLGPVGVYRGIARQLIMDQADRIYVYDEEAQKIQVFEPRPAYAALTAQPPPATPVGSQQAIAALPGPATGDGGNTYFSPVFDSRTPGTVWHRVVLDVTIPENTQVLLWVSTSDQFLSLDQVRDKDTWTGPLYDPEDALLPPGTAPGRYLWVRLQLIGTRQETPRIRSLRVYFPRLSYLRYLPSVYQEDAAGRVFLERFLSIFETLLGGLESNVTGFVRYLDARAAPPEFLPWLASWLGFVMDSTWSQPVADACAVCGTRRAGPEACPACGATAPSAAAAAAPGPAQVQPVCPAVERPSGEPRLRRLIQAAPDLFRRRGTRSGLEDMVEIYTGRRPYIIEQFQVSSDEEQRYGTEPCSFCVLLRPFSAQNEDERKAIAALVQANKPAHTCTSIVALEPWISLDDNTYLGINTYLYWFTSSLDVDARLEGNTILTAPDEL